MMNADRTEGEYAILLGPNVKGMGLGWTLMNMMIDYGRSMDLDHIEGQVLSENGPMLQMCRALGFKLRESREEPGVTIVTLDLRAEKESKAAATDASAGSD